MTPSHNPIRLSLTVVALFFVALAFAGCETNNQLTQTSQPPDIGKYDFEATGEDYLISALEEVQAIADWSQFYRNGPSANLSENTTAIPRMTLAKTATDTVYIYGQIIPGGYGAVVTERHAHPKGLLLITVRKTYGKGNGHIVTETKRYVSYRDHRNDNPQQTNVTEMFGLQADTIVAHVLRNGTLETYTFRLPVITKVVNPQDGSIRVTSRYASNGAIVSKVQDGGGNLVQLRRSYGQADGSTVTRTEFPDASWRQVRTHGEADGTITRETTSGLPSLGSGIVTRPPRPPLPVLGLWIPLRTQGEANGTMSPEKAPRLPSFASGAAAIRLPKPPLPVMGLRTPLRMRDEADGTITREFTTGLPSLASGQSIPGSIPRPVPLGRSIRSHSEFIHTITLEATSSLQSFASGNSACPPVVPRPVMGSWIQRQTMSAGHRSQTCRKSLAIPSLASGVTVCPKPPLPVLASGTPPRTQGKIDLECT